MAHVKFSLFIIFLHFSSLLWCAGQTIKYWSSIELLTWWVQNSPINIPLVTGNSNPKAFGLINEPGTQILFGRGSSLDQVHFGELTGSRFIIGAWLDRASQYGLEASAFFLPPGKKPYSTSSFSGSFPVVNVPFNSGSENVLVNKETPNQVVLNNTIKFYGYEINYLAHVPKNRCLTTFFTGVRFFRFQESFRLIDSSFPVLGIVEVKDKFIAQNNFYGLQLGARTQFNWNKLLLNLSMAIAAGSNHHLLRISGETDFKHQRLQNFGIFSEPSNLGTHKAERFAIIPELRAQLGYHLTANIRPFLTYDFFYMNHLIRPLKNIDRNINTSQNSLIGGSGVLFGSPSPIAQLSTTSVWVQGVSAGLDVNF